MTSTPDFPGEYLLAGDERVGHGPHRVDVAARVDARGSVDRLRGHVVRRADDWSAPP